jgi:D-proline reductase (dithiol) PrdB
MGATHRTHVSYIDRTRAYYAALGYERPYQYAHYDEVPFARLPKPLAECRVALITTAGPWVDDPAQRQKPFDRRPLWAGDTAQCPERLFTDNLAWDKESTHTRDVQTFLPIDHLKAYAAAGRIGEIAPRFYGVPTEYSQSRTIREDAPAIAAMCREDKVDAVLIAAL